MLAVGVSMFFPHCTGGHAGTRKTKRGKRCRFRVVIWLRVCIDYSVCNEFDSKHLSFQVNLQATEAPKVEKEGFCHSHVLGDHCPVQFVFFQLNDRDQPFLIEKAQWNPVNGVPFEYT